MSLCASGRAVLSLQGGTAGQGHRSSCPLQQGDPWQGPGRLGQACRQRVPAPAPTLALPVRQVGLAACHRLPPSLLGREDAGGMGLRTKAGDVPGARANLGTCSLGWLGKGSQHQGPWKASGPPSPRAGAGSPALGSHHPVGVGKVKGFPCMPRGSQCPSEPIDPTQAILATGRLGARHFLSILVYLLPTLTLAPDKASTPERPQLEPGARQSQVLLCSAEYTGNLQGRKWGHPAALASPDLEACVDHLMGTSHAVATVSDAAHAPESAWCH